MNLNRISDAIAAVMRRLATAAVLVIAAPMALALGCGGLPIIGNPSPGDRTRAMRDTLESATGRDCDLMSGDDLADIEHLNVLRAANMKRSDFAGLDNLQSLRVDGEQLDVLPSNVLTNLQSFVARGRFYGTAARRV